MPESMMATNKTFADMTETESIAACAKARHELRKERKEPTAVVKAFTEIKAEKISWLWPGRIPVGMLTLYAGNAGLGKSSLSLDLAARLSRGSIFPDGTKALLGDTIILAGEDIAGVTIKPRLEALGADMAHVHILLGKRGDTGDIDIVLSDTGTIRDAIDQIKANGGDVKLIIIDPLESFLGPIDAYRNTEVRTAIRGIISLAEHEHFAILAIQHLTKKTGIDAIHQVSGSVAFVAAARTVWIFMKDPDNPDGCLFLHLKTNIGKKMTGFHYSIVTAKNGVGVVVWGSPANNDPDDVLNAPHMPKVAPEQEAVLQELREAGAKGMTTGKLAEALAKRESAVSNILNKLKTQGKVISPAYGLWAVKDGEVSLSPPPPIGKGGESESPGTVSPEVSPVVKVKNETVPPSEADAYTSPEQRALWENGVVF